MRIFAAMLATASVVSFAAAAAAAADTNPMHTGTKLVGTLNGQTEVPPGDPDGSGSFTAWLDPAKGRVCYSLSTKGIDTPTMAHIHKGAAGSAGPAAIALTNPAQDLTDTCTNADAAVLNAIIADPDDYYVNVHNKEHPGGALRAQLMKPKM